MISTQCQADPEDPSGVACKTCSDVSQKSKKVIHRLPCLRWILTETIICRAEGVELTKRWSDTEMRNIGSNDWTDSDIRTIQIRFSSCSRPAVFKVRKFRPVEGDSIDRTWKDRRGTLQTTPIEPYAFRDVNEAAESYRKYVVVNMLGALQEFVENEEVDIQVRKTYGLM